MQLHEQFLDVVTAWAQRQGDILGLLLVGSFARGEARPDSDIDVVVLCENREKYLSDTSWTGIFGVVTKLEKEDWGKAVSLRVFYSGLPEVEFVMVNRDWAAINPVDEGTAGVVKKGAKIFYDPEALLNRLLQL